MIPIKNIYYLLCYAWNHFDEGDIADIDLDDFNNGLDLLAFILCQGMSRAIKKGLEKGYVRHEETLCCVHGRIDIGYTVRHGLLQKSCVRCLFDELTYDILQNQIIKSTIRILLIAENLHESLKTKLRGIYRKLSQIQNITLNEAVFSRVTFHKNNRYYRFLLHVCELIVRCKIPDGDQGTYRFRNFLRDEKRMSLIFQQFVFNFLVKEQTEYRIKSEILEWPAKPLEPEHKDDIKFLPKMITDISARSNMHTLIIDTKYYVEALKSKFGGRDKIISGNLYQIHTYLSSLENRGFPDNMAEGLLLYPTNGYHVDLSWDIKGHIIRVKTIDLGLEWEKIHENLLKIIKLGF